MVYLCLCHLNRDSVDPMNVPLQTGRVSTGMVVGVSSDDHVGPIGRIVTIIIEP